MKLHYIGPEPCETALPLAEGWPAADHDEPDRDVAEAKVSSGAYERPPRPSPAPRAAATLTKQTEAPGEV